MTSDNENRLDSFALHRAARELRARYIAFAMGKVARGVVGLLRRRILEPTRAYFKHRRQVEALMNMDDRMLRDMGLSRGGIAYALKNGRQGEPANTNEAAKTPRAA